MSDELVVGVDVGGRRKGFHLAALRGDRVEAGPLRIRDVAGASDWIRSFDPELVALDAPISCAPDGERSRSGERRLARAVCGIRWTPDRASMRGNPYYGWVEHGLELLAALRRSPDPVEVIEVFPTASFTRWSGPRAGRRRSEWTSSALDGIALDGLPARRLSQDDRDAIAAALTARDHLWGATERFEQIVVPLGRGGG